MQRRCQRRGGLWWVTTDAGTSRDDIADLWKRITRLQQGHTLRKYAVVVFETGRGLHSHILFIGNPGIKRRLERSKFAAIIKVKPVTDPNRLARKYLTKERTPQAGFRRSHLLGGRVKGSHRLDGGGDRVRLSGDLRRDALTAGAIVTWQRTYAKRSASAGLGENPPSISRPPQMSQQRQRCAQRPCRC
jgi:hypothetical protein